MAKEVIKHFRLTAHDAGIFSGRAKEAGMKESDYFRLLITQEPNDYPEVRQGLKSLINEVNRIGVNINEIVHNNNSGLVAYMRKLNEEMEKVVAALGYH